MSFRLGREVEGVQMLVHPDELGAVGVERGDQCGRPLGECLIAALVRLLTKAFGLRVQSANLLFGEHQGRTVIDLFLDESYAAQERLEGFGRTLEVAPRTRRRGAGLSRRRGRDRRRCGRSGRRSRCGRRLGRRSCRRRGRRGRRAAMVVAAAAGPVPAPVVVTPTHVLAQLLCIPADFVRGLAFQPHAGLARNRAVDERAPVAIHDHRGAAVGLRFGADLDLSGAAHERGRLVGLGRHGKNHERAEKRADHEPLDPHLLHRHLPFLPRCPAVSRDG